MSDEPISRMEWLNLQLAQRQRAAVRSYAQPQESYRDPARTIKFEAERESETKFKSKGRP